MTRQRRFASAVTVLLATLAVPTGGAAQQASQPAPALPRLTVTEAEQLALRNNPRISVARLLALAQAQVTREVRSAEMPTASANLTAVGAHDGSRITAGALNNPIVYNRAAGGLTVSQLITDFGRTHNLVLSAKSNAKAQLENQRATEMEITLTADQAFYQALSAQAVLKVAQQTVAQRQDTADEVSALAHQKLRSDLDQSLAAVQLSQAKLLLVDAQNAAQDAMASLNAVLGSETDQQYTLVDETSGTPAPAPQDPETMVQLAFSQRPDLAALNDTSLASRQYSKAERDLWMPTVSALAAGGGTPGASRPDSSPRGTERRGRISTFPYSTDSSSTHVRRKRNCAPTLPMNRCAIMREEIARDVRTGVLHAQAAFQRIGVTEEMLKQSNLALDLAQARYKLGLSGIVELSQAQLAQTEAEIAYANARYSYQTALAEVRFQTGQ